MTRVPSFYKMKLNWRLLLLLVCAPSALKKNRGYRMQPLHNVGADGVKRQLDISKTTRAFWL